MVSVFYVESRSFIFFFCVVLFAGHFILMQIDETLVDVVV